MRFNSRHQERIPADVIQDREPLFALGYQVVGTVRGGDEAHDGGGGAYAMQIVGGLRGAVLRRDGGLFLQQQPDAALRAHGLLGGGERRVAGDGDGQHDAWKQHGIADRQYDEHVFHGAVLRPIIANVHGASRVSRRNRHPRSRRRSITA